MHIPISALVVVVIVIGFLTGSTVYFYSQSRERAKQTADSQKRFDGEVLTDQTAPTKTKVDELTKPDQPRNRLSYPANSHTVAPGESLFAIASKMEVPVRMIVLANTIVNENIVQAGTVLIIPNLFSRTDFYRINFIVNDERASQLNRELRNQGESDYLDIIAAAKKQAENHFGIKKDQEFILLEHNKHDGTALVEVKQSPTTSALIGLIQPKEIGERGLWAMIYIEYRADNE